MRSPQHKAAFATRLRSIMDERGLSLAETARRISEHLPDGESISQGSLSHYRTGRSIPRLRYLDALSLALGIDKSELMDHQMSDARTPTARPNGSPKAKRQEPKDAQMDTSTSDRPTSPTLPIGIEDLGDEVHLKIDQRLPWDVALKILDALKRKKIEQ